MRLSIFALTLVATTVFASTASASTIDAIITADNHYAFYTGNMSGSTVNFHGAGETGYSGSPGTYNWSMAETYQVTTSDDVIYVAAWSDDACAQGLLASFNVDGHSLLSGDPVWQVFATYENLNDGDPPPTVANLSHYIGVANNTSGWETIAVGGLNGDAPWGTVDGISPNAHWMWGQDKVGNPSPFDPGADHGEYLIFRTTVPEPATMALLALSALSLMSGARRRRPTR
jgi:hypothetical protein